LEMTLVGPELEVVAEAAIAFSGGRVEPAVNGKPITGASARQIRIGDRVRVGALRAGARAYLCVAGGLARTREPFSRRLVSGEIVSLQAPPGVPRAGAAATAARPADARKEVLIRVLAGPQRERFEKEGVATFLSSSFRVSVSSDRRGIRLEGPPVANRESPDIPPEGTTLGGVQVPRDGQPIVLGPDRPVTGGYAKIATVIAADFPLLAQAPPGTAVRFRDVTLAQALAASHPEPRVPR
jgi:antagonist of KipI